MALDMRIVTVDVYIKLNRRLCHIVIRIAPEIRARKVRGVGEWGEWG